MTAQAIPAPGRSAINSDCGRYRYDLFRKVGNSGRVATFIMLNPSTADHEVDDPTIRKVMGFCRRWAYGEVHVVNLFAFRAARPADLRKADDVAVPENREWIRRAVELARGGLVVCAWGTHGAFMGQDKTVLGWIVDLCRPSCLGLTRDGHPRHPLYVPYSVELVPYVPGYFQEWGSDCGLLLTGPAAQVERVRRSKAMQVCRNAVGETSAILDRTDPPRFLDISANLAQKVVKAREGPG